MNEFEHQLLAVNCIQLSLYSCGPADGKPVWMLHGFPECWHSWQHQMRALAASGYRVFVPEMRGYGQSSAPQEVDAYDVLTLCADIQGAMDALGHERVAMVGHDWGAPVAWHLALLEPQRVEVLATLSVPFAGRAKRPAVEIMREVFAGKFFYILYFQQPGRAEAELDADIAVSLRHFLGDNVRLAPDQSPDGRLFDGLSQPPAHPDWCSAEDFQWYVRTFEGRGFHGALNWYRNFERSWQRTEPLAGRKVEQPTLFLIGDRDPVGRFEAYTVQRMPEHVPNLEQHVLENCGHWIQSQQPERVNALLGDFLGRHYPA